jgi:hypothetical protein
MQPTNSGQFHDSPERIWRGHLPTMAAPTPNRKLNMKKFVCLALPMLAASALAHAEDFYLGANLSSATRGNIQSVDGATKVEQGQSKKGCLTDYMPATRCRKTGQWKPAIVAKQVLPPLSCRRIIR